MFGVVASLATLAEGLQAGFVTTDEAAERLHVLARRLPTFVVWAADMRTADAVLCYLSTAREQQAALAAVKWALASPIPEGVSLQATPAQPGVIWRWDRMRGE